MWAREPGFMGSTETETTMTTTTPKTAAQMTARCTAEVAYRIRRKAVRDLLRRLELKLLFLDRGQAHNPRDWGYAGDLGRIEVRLCEALGVEIG